jgi:anthranilate phosphoribosyltransferase
VAAGLADDLREGAVLAASALDEGRAGDVLDRLVGASRAHAAG